MRRLTLYTLIYCSLLSIHALSWDEEWVYSYGTSGYGDIIHDIEVHNGYIYVTGCTNFKSTIEGCSGDLYVAKFDPFGTEVWKKKASNGKNAYIYGEALAVDDTGDVYVTGAYSLTNDFDDYDIFVAKLGNEGGDFVWPSFTIWNDVDGRWDSPKDIALDSNGHVFITGFADAGFLSDTYFKRFVNIKIDSGSGQKLEETVDFPGFGDTRMYGKSIECDSESNVYATSFIRSGPDEYVFLKKYDNNLETFWPSYGYRPSWDSILLDGMVVDEEDNAYVYGTLSNKDPEIENSPFILKINEDKEVIWNKEGFSGLGLLRSGGTAMVLSQNGSALYVAGWYKGTDWDWYKTGCYTAKIPTDSLDGTPEWIELYEHPSGVYGIEPHAIAPAPDGGVYIVGITNHNDEPPYEIDKAFIIKYHSDGYVIAEDEIDYGEYRDMFTELDTDSAGNIYAAGITCTGTPVNMDMLLVKYADPGSSGIDDEKEPNIPGVFSLSPAYPNPSNGVATIAFALPHACEVDLSVYDIKGRKVAALANGKYAQGEYEMSVSGLASGIYLYQMNADNFSKTRKMVVK